MTGSHRWFRARSAVGVHVEGAGFNTPAWDPGTRFHDRGRRAGGTHSIRRHARPLNRVRRMTRHLSEAMRGQQG